MDVIASAGFASQGEEEVQVFLGGATGLSVTPLTITGMNVGFAYGPEVDAGGNFNGDAILKPVWRLEISSSQAWEKIPSMWFPVRFHGVGRPST